MALKWAHNYVDFWAVLVANNLYTNPSIYFLLDYLSVCLIFTITSIFSNFHNVFKRFFCWFLKVWIMWLRAKVRIALVKE